MKKQVESRSKKQSRKICLVFLCVELFLCFRTKPTYVATPKPTDEDEEDDLEEEGAVEEGTPSTHSYLFLPLLTLSCLFHSQEVLKMRR